MTNTDWNEALDVPPSLHAAYEAADYDVVGGVTPVVLRIGARAPNLALEGVARPRRMAVITAWNPFSAPLSAADNAAHQARLVREIERAGRRFLPALGRDPAGSWAPEPSLAVFDPSDDELDDWMLAFGQNAVVVAELERVCALRFHPHERARFEAEGPVAERAAARLWARAWNTLDLDMVEGALHGDVQYTSKLDNAALEGHAAVSDHLRNESQRLHGSATRRARLNATVGTTAVAHCVRPCAVLSLAEATTPTAVVLFTLRRGRIARVDVHTPELPRPT